MAVQSKFLAVGAVVPWAKAKVGAIATQAYSNTSYGPEGLRLLGKGISPEQVLDCLIKADPDRAWRQVGIVNARGQAAAFTGERCLPWAGHLIGEGFTCQGNILVSQAVVVAMAEAFVKASGSLADRLLAALEAGQAAGGDRRGQQSATLVVVREQGGYGGQNDRYIDLRVDDHPRPIEELKRLYELHQLYFAPAKPADLVPLDKTLIATLQRLLKTLGYWKKGIDGSFSPEFKETLSLFCHMENLEEHLRNGDQFDIRILRYIEFLVKTKAKSQK